MSERLVIFDAEIAGPDARRNALIQFAAIAYGDDHRPIEEIAVKLDFAPALADPKALERNSFSRDSWAGALHPKAAVVTIASFLRRHATVEHVGPDGKPCLVARVMAYRADRKMDALATLFEDPGRQAGEPKRSHLEPGEFLPVYPLPLCVLQFAQWTLRARREAQPKNWKLATLAEHFGIPTSPLYEPVADVRIAREIALRCTGILAGGGAFD